MARAGQSRDLHVSQLVGCQWDIGEDLTTYALSFMTNANLYDVVIGFLKSPRGEGPAGKYISSHSSLFVSLNTKNPSCLSSLHFSLIRTFVLLILAELSFIQI